MKRGAVQVIRRRRLFKQRNEPERTLPPPLSLSPLPFGSSRVQVTPADFAADVLFGKIWFSNERLRPDHENEPAK